MGAGVSILNSGGLIQAYSEEIDGVKWRTDDWNGRCEIEPIDKESLSGDIKQPEAVTYTSKSETTPLSIESTYGTDEKGNRAGNLLYQWYVNTSDSHEGGTPVEGATESTYTPNLDQNGTNYYDCVVTNQCGTERYTVTSNTAKVIIDMPESYEILEGAITAANKKIDSGLYKRDIKFVLYQTTVKIAEKQLKKGNELTEKEVNAIIALLEKQEKRLTILK